MKTKVHFLDPKMIQSNLPIRIYLIGCGGNGSHLLSKLLMTHHALTQLDKPGLHVTVFDPDHISPTNIGRQQNFYPSEVGHNKAKVLVSKLNRTHGLQWKANPIEVNENTQLKCNILISCVDTVKARKQIQKAILRQNKQNENHVNPVHEIKYWLDMGNTRNTGQVLLATVKDIEQPESHQYLTVNSLPDIFTKYPQIADDDTEDIQGPACSYAAALQEQDLFINAPLSAMAGSLIFKLLNNHVIEHSGLFYNAERFHSTPIPIS